MINIAKEFIILLISVLYIFLATSRSEHDIYGYLIVGAMVGVYGVEIVGILLDTAFSVVECVGNFKRSRELAKCRPYTVEDPGPTPIEGPPAIVIKHTLPSRAESIRYAARETVDESTDEFNCSRRTLARHTVKRRPPSRRILVLKKCGTDGT